MLHVFSAWLERRKAIRARWSHDARLLVKGNEHDAYYEAHRRAAHCRAAGQHGEAWHWTKVAAEVARISPHAEMEMAVVQAIHDEKPAA